MSDDDLKELRELVEFLKASGISEFDMERPELKVRLKFAAAEAAAAPTPGTSAVDFAALARLLGAGAGAATPAPMPAAEPGTPVAAASSAEAAEPASGGAAVDENAGLHIVKSPLVGTFYDAPSPGADTFARMGETVENGKVLCIVEAMKIMNEIESDARGEVVKVFAKPGQPVEYGQPLFGIRV